ncbi:MAG: zf-HC2 domain-containing protein [Nitrospirae bacterium]|nr:zf-HC2 domain-containing protein [Nitrospirota bacterium]
MRSSHDRIKEMFPEYLKGALPEEVREDIEAHLKCCEECSGEFFLITELVKVDVPDPGDLFWKTLPQRVRRAVEKEEANLYKDSQKGKSKIRTERLFGVPLSIKSLLFKPLPVAVTIIVLVFLIFAYSKKKEIPELDPFLKDPLTASVLDYSDITEKDILLITERLTDDGLYLDQENFMEYSYYSEFASLSSKEMESLYEVLGKQQNKGG